MNFHQICNIVCTKFLIKFFLEIFYFAELAVLDPPYGLKMEKKWDMYAWEEGDFRRVLDAVTDSSTNQDMCFVSFIAISQYEPLMKAIKSSGWKHPSFIVLHKTNKESAGSKRFTSTNEFMVMCFRSSSANHIWNYEDQPEERTDLWCHPIVSNHYICTDDDLPVNRCQKSQMLLKRLLRHHSTPGCTVLDLCAGSHALLFACLDMNRSCVSVEKDVRQYNASVQRMRHIVCEMKMSMKKQLNVRSSKPGAKAVVVEDTDKGEKPSEKNGKERDREGQKRVFEVGIPEDDEGESNIYAGDTLPMEQSEIHGSMVEIIENLAVETQTPDSNL